GRWFKSSPRDQKYRSEAFSPLTFFFSASTRADGTLRRRLRGDLTVSLPDPPLDGRGGMGGSPAYAVASESTVPQTCADDVEPLKKRCAELEMDKAILELAAAPGA
ncbi:MAG: hypothetical protein ACOX4F_09815, partial [Atopobiaceae bacterium]